MGWKILGWNDGNLYYNSRPERFHDFSAGRHVSKERAVWVRFDQSCVTNKSRQGLDGVRSKLYGVNRHQRTTGLPDTDHCAWSVLLTEYIRVYVLLCIDGANTSSCIPQTSPIPIAVLSFILAANIWYLTSWHTISDNWGLTPHVLYLTFHIWHLIPNIWHLTFR